VAWLWSLVLRLFGRAPPALPSPALDELTAARERRELERRETEQAAAALTDVLGAQQRRLVTLGDERIARRDELERHRGDRLRLTRARLIELTADTATSSLEVDVGCDGLPAGIALVLRSAIGLWRDPIDGSISADGANGESLRARLRRLDERRPAEVARRVAAASCSLRNRVRDLEQRARHAHDERVKELAARRVPEAAPARDEQLAAAQLPVARHAQETVDAAASQLEKLIDEVRHSWEQRIEGCLGLEQLRAEVTAIEDGAAHRLALVCDELREGVTIQFVRQVLELARPLRQDLSRRRLEVARGRSTKVEEAFEDIRFAFPTALDGVFAALRAPGVGQLMTSERGLFDSLFRTLTRAKRECVTRLAARLDDIQQTTARELFAAAVYVSPLLMATLGRLLDELLDAHERWIEARVSEEQQAYDAVRARNQRAIQLMTPLEEREATLATLLEAGANSS
jgi:hypothetical protein